MLVSVENSLAEPKPRSRSNVIYFAKTALSAFHCVKHCQGDFEWDVTFIQGHFIISGQFI